MPTTPEDAAPAASESLYPTIERFAEAATAETVQDVFGSLKAGLGALKGPPATQAPKIGKAVERAEELLTHLLHVREKLEAEQKKAGGGR
jgi:citrate synthase